MARTKGAVKEIQGTRPFFTPEGEESRLVSLAYNLAEKRLMEGTASSQEVTHFLKLGSRKEILEREKLEEENRLLRAKTETLQSQRQTEELYKNAINAFRWYAGQGDPDEDY